MKFKHLLTAAASLCLCIPASAQIDDEMTLAESVPQLPLDASVRKGTLPNGLTYSIRHNAWPEDRAYFYIAQKVGSMQEEDDQLGLAHFLEHMCFNGTTHFPGNKLKTYLESIGVKFGENLNAYTSFDETVYNIDNVKTDREPALDSCLLILHDWSHDLLLEDDEIDKERGVINEEWRVRRSASQRMYEAMLPDIYPGSKYAHRMPIGTMDIVMNFPYDALRTYYKKWYRPDLQAVIVVGDIDVDRMEQKIKSVFSDIKAAENGAVREYYPVPDTPSPIVSVQSDKEQTKSVISMMFKRDVFPENLKNTAAYYAQSYIEGMVSMMFRMRIQEMLQKENPPFMSASMGKGRFFVSKTKDAFSGSVVFKENDHERAFSALYREMLRAARYGFTAAEYERCKQEYLSQLDNQYAQRDKVYSSQYVSECVNNFLDNEPMPGIEWIHANMKDIANQIPLEAVNEYLSHSIDKRSYPDGKNVVITMFAPEKDDVTLPTKDELLGILHKIEDETIEPYREEVNNEPLITTPLKGCKVKSITDDAFGAKLVTLKNGVKIHVKKTDFTPNVIQMEAPSWGGNSLYPNSEYHNTANIGLVTVGGWGNFSKSDLNKKLAGIQASASPFIGNRVEGVSGNCVTKDLETMLQLTYLCFTSPRRDDAAFKSYIERWKANIENEDLNPFTALKDTASRVLYDNNVRSVRWRKADIDRIDYDRLIQLYKERFADGNDFEFFFIGDIDLDTALPLFQKYLGSLPVLKGEEKANLIDERIAKGEVKNYFEKELQTPSSVSIFVYHAPVKETLRVDLTTSMLEQLMTMLYTETVREDEGGAYGVPVNGAVSNYPEELVSFQITLQTAPEKRERMTEVIYKGIDDMCDNGPKAENLQKVKEYMHRQHVEALKNNGYWLSAMVNLAREGQDNVTDYDRLVDEISAADIQQMARNVFRSGNHIEVGMSTPLK